MSDSTKKTAQGILKNSNTTSTELWLYASIIAVFSITLMILFSRVRKNESMPQTENRPTVVAQSNWYDMFVAEPD